MKGPATRLSEPRDDATEDVRRGMRLQCSVAAVAALELLCALGVVVAQLLLVRQELIAGARELKIAAREARAISPLMVPADRRSVSAHVSRAVRDFGTAETETRRWQGLTARLAWLPFAGQQLASAEPGAEAGLDTAHGVQQLLTGLDPVWTVLPRNGGFTVLSRVLPHLVEEQDHFRRAGRDFERAESALSSIRHKTGDRSLDADVASLRAVLPALSSTSRWLTLSPLLLGWKRPSRFLLVWQDSAELRATGRYIGAADLLTFRDGSTSSRFTGSWLPHETRSVPPPLPETVYTSEGYWIFADSNWSPDFPTSARLERWLYGENTGRWADGIVNVVDSGVVDILRATGSIYLPTYRLWINAANVTARAQEFVNGGYKGPLTAGEPDTIRKQFFGAVLDALLRRVESLPMRAMPGLARAVAEAAARRDLMLYDQRPVIETTIRQSGMSGAMEPSHGDFLYVVDDNRSYSKLNPYVQETAAYHVDFTRNYAARAVLTLRYYLRPSPPTLEGEGPDFGLVGSKHDYLDFLRVYVPYGSRLQSVSGMDAWKPEAAYGYTQYSGRVFVGKGRSVRVELRYSLPAAVALGGRYTLLVERQPATNLRGLEVSLHTTSGSFRRSGVVVRRLLFRLSLSRDVRLGVPLGSVDASQTPVTSPVPSAGDPYIPFEYMRDPAHPV